MKVYLLIVLVQFNLVAGGLSTQPRLTKSGAYYPNRYSIFKGSDCHIAKHGQQSLYNCWWECRYSSQACDSISWNKYTQECYTNKGSCDLKYDNDWNLYRNDYGDCYSNNHVRAANLIIHGSDTGFQYNSVSPQIIGTSYSKFFHHSYTVNCPIISAKLLGSTGSTYTGLKITIGSAPQYPVSMKVNTPFGYSETFRMQVQVKPYDGRYSTYTVNSYSFTVRQYADCSDSLSALSPSFTAIPFKSGGSTVIKVANYESIFTHIKKTDCPLESCALMTAASCGTTLTQTNLVLDTAAQYQVSGKENVATGYIQKFCYSCKIKSLGIGSSSAAITFNVDNQSIKGWADCSDSLAPKTVSFTLLSFNKYGTGIVKISTYENMFTHSKKTYCPLKSCSLMKSGSCGLALTQTNLVLRSASPYTVTGKENVVSGYTQTFCYRCKVDQSGGISEVTFDKDALVIRAYAKCPDSLTPKQIDLENIQFNKTGPGITKIKTYQEAFTHTNKLDCPVQVCALMTSSKCSEPLVQTHIVFDPTSPYKLTGKENVSNGYTQQFCFMCQVNPADPAVSIITFTLDKLSLRQYADCSDSLKPKEFTFNSLKYNAAGSKVIMFQTYEDMFTHTKKIDCPVKTCALMLVKNCDVELQESNVVIGVEDPFMLEGKENVDAGYVQSFCFQCIIEPVGGADKFKFNKDEQKIIQEPQPVYPHFESKVGPSFKVTIVNGIDDKLEDSTTATYRSPKAVDDSKTQLTMKIDTRGNTFLEGVQNDDKTFSLNVVRTKAPKKNASYFVGVQLSNELGMRSELYVLLIDIEYIDKFVKIDVNQTIEVQEKLVATNSSVDLNVTNTTALVNITKVAFGLTAIEPDRPLPNLTNLTPKQEQQLEVKVNKTMDVLNDALGINQGFLNVNLTNLTQPNEKNVSGFETQIRELPKGALQKGWFQSNLQHFSKNLKQFDGDFMKYVAKMGPPGKPNLKPDQIPYLGCYIQSIDQLGKVTLQFNITLIPELIYEEDLKRVLRFEITPQVDGSDEDGQEEKRYAFDWDVISFDKEQSTIDFQLNFENADSISMGDHEDQIKVIILDRRYFQPQVDRRLLEQDNDTFRQLMAADRAPIDTGVKVIRQMPNNEQSKQLQKRAQQANNAGSFLTILIFVMQSYMMGVFKKLIGTLLALQIVVHLGLINVKIPGAVTCFNSTLKKVTYFNVLNFLADLNEYVLPFNYQEQTRLRETYLSIALRGLGFKYTNSILTLKNAGQMLFLNYCLIIVFFFLTLKVLFTRKNKDRRMKRKIKEKVMFGPFLSIGIRAFIPMTIASYLNLKYWSDMEVFELGEKMGDGFSVLVAFLVCVFLPIAMLYVALVPKEWLLGVDFKIRWGFLYQSIKTENFMQRAYYFMFILRRAILIFMCLLAYNYPGIQVQGIMACNIIFLVWSAKAMAFLHPFNNKMDLNTEMFLAIITYHMLCFTDFIQLKGDGLKTRVLMGYSFILWVCLLVLINLIFVFQEIGRLFKLRMIKRYRIMKRKWFPETKIIHQDGTEQTQGYNASIIEIDTQAQILRPSPLGQNELDQEVDIKTKKIKKIQAVPKQRVKQKVSYKKKSLRKQLNIVPEVASDSEVSKSVLNIFSSSDTEGDSSRSTKKLTTTTPDLRDHSVLNNNDFLQKQVDEVKDMLEKEQENSEVLMKSALELEASIKKNNELIQKLDKMV